MNEEGNDEVGQIYVCIIRNHTDGFMTGIMSRVSGVIRLHTAGYFLPRIQV